MLQRIPLDDTRLYALDDTARDMSSLCRAESVLLAFLRSANEPTEHFINKLYKKYADIAKRCRVLLILPIKPRTIQPSPASLRAGRTPRYCWTRTTFKPSLQGKHLMSLTTILCCSSFQKTVSAAFALPATPSAAQSLSAGL